MGIVPLCTPIPFALSRSFHSVPPIIRGQAASNYFIGASAVPDKRPRIDPFSFRSAEHVYRIVLRKVSAATFSARFSTVEREIQPRPTPFFTPFPRPSRKQPSVILFHRVFNKDRDWAASKALLLLFVKYFLSVSYVTFHRGERYFLYIDYTRFIDVSLPFPNAT